LKAKFEAKLDHTGHWDNQVSERNHHHTSISEKGVFYRTHPVALWLAVFSDL
jgi:hypothetical protein